MTISPARLAANRQNAAQSTGPRTEAGKRRSRANAVKHGLQALVVPVEDEATIRARAVGVFEAMRPQNAYQAWVCTRIAQNTIRLDRLGVMERQFRAEAIHRAEVCWEEDQQGEANRIAARLARDPVRTVGQLRRSVAGCDWLIDRWTRLADATARHDWTEDQQTLVHDLLGTPPEFRDLPPTDGVEAEGCTIPLAPAQAQLARHALDELHQHRDVVTDHDTVAQALAVADLNDLGNRDLQRFRRHERSILNDLNTAHAMSQHESPHTATNSRFLQSVPAEFFGPKFPVPPTCAEPSPVVPNEPKPVVPNEPKVATPNEPKPLVPNEPKFAPFPLPPRHETGLSPDLLALLEADLPDPDTLDPAWCRAFIAANLGISGDQLRSDPAPPPPAMPGSEPVRD